MANSALETVQKLVQDVVAPDVRAIKVKVEELEKRIDERFKAADQRQDERFKVVDEKFKVVDERFNSVDQRFDALEEKMDSMHARLLAVLGELKASNELTTFREVASIRERLAVVENQLAHQRSAA